MCVGSGALAVLTLNDFFLRGFGDVGAGVQDLPRSISLVF